MSDSGIGWRGIEQRPVTGLSAAAALAGETGANGPGVFGSMAQGDNRICAEFLGPPGGKCYDTPTPYRSGDGVKVTDHVVGSRLGGYPK